MLPNVSFRQYFPLVDFFFFFLTLIWLRVLLSQGAQGARGPFPSSFFLFLIFQWRGSTGLTRGTGMASPLLGGKRVPCWVLLALPRGHGAKPHFSSRSNWSVSAPNTPARGIAPCPRSCPPNTTPRRSSFPRAQGGRARRRRVCQNLDTSCPWDPERKGVPGVDKSSRFQCCLVSLENKFFQVFSFPSLAWRYFLDPRGR